MRRFLSLLLLAILSAGPASAQRPTLTLGQSFLTGSLDPAEGSAGWALTSHGVAEKLFTVDRAGRVVPELAESAERTGPTEWRIKLRKDRLFANGSPVRAAEVAEALNRTGEKNPAARASAGRITARVLDELTVVLTSERPTPVMPSVLAEWAFAIYRQTPGGLVFTGPYDIDSLRPGDSLLLKPNPHYPGADTRSPLRIRRFGDTQAMALALENREIDFAFNLPVEALSRLRNRTGVTVVTYPVAYQYMMWMNTKRPGLDDPLVRRAIDLAVDRRELVAAIRGGEPATGAFSTAYPFAGKEVRPFDTTQAARLLDQAGWKLEADGKRRKDGRTLDLVLVAYPQRPDLVTMQPVIRARLAALGLNPQTRVVEQAAAVANSRDFDLLLWAQHKAPAGDPGFFLNAFFRTGAGNNYSGYSSPAVDALLDRFATAEAAADRAAVAADVHRAIFQDAPVSFLVTPAWHIAYGPQLAGYEAWGSDYYIVRADLRPK